MDTKVYRKMILREAIAKRVEGIFREVAEIYEFEIETMAVVEDHVHIFLVHHRSMLLGK